MAILLFLVDTSASMAQKTYQGTTILDTARSIVEQLLKQRGRDAGARYDRYMLMSFEEFPVNVKGRRQTSAERQSERAAQRWLGSSHKRAHSGSLVSRLSNVVASAAAYRTPIQKNSTLSSGSFERGKLRSPKGKSGSPAFQVRCGDVGQVSSIGN